VFNFNEKTVNDKDIDFCSSIVNKLSRMRSETTISPYSIALVNPDNGLKEQVPKTYNDKIETESIEKATKMVSELKSRSS
jgi:hypothetical protein